MKKAIYGTIMIMAVLSLLLLSGCSANDAQVKSMKDTCRTRYKDIDTDKPYKLAERSTQTYYINCLDEDNEVHTIKFQFGSKRPA